MPYAFIRFQKASRAYLGRVWARLVAKLAQTWYPKKLNMVKKTMPQSIKELTVSKTVAGAWLTMTGNYFTIR